MERLIDKKKLFRRLLSLVVLILTLLWLIVTVVWQLLKKPGAPGLKPVSPTARPTLNDTAYPLPSVDPQLLRLLLQPENLF